jgi:hypothetical protein
MYTSRRAMPALDALFSVVHAAVSTLPVDLKARGMMYVIPELLKQEAVELETAAETSSPY